MEPDDIYCERRWRFFEEYKELCRKYGFVVGANIYCDPVISSAYAQDQLERNFRELERNMI